MNGAHFDAIVARLRDRPSLSARVHDSAAPLNADGELVRGAYVVVYGGSPDSLASNRAFSPQSSTSEAEYVYTIRCVDTNPAGVRAVQRQVADQLIGFRPVIAGRICRPVWLSAGDDVEPDNDVKPPLFYADDEYTLASLPSR